jgi:hypothetical protein
MLRIFKPIIVFLVTIIGLKIRCVFSAQKAEAFLTLN